MTIIDNKDEAANCLRRLLGDWRGTGRGGFPTMNAFRYREVLNVSQGASTDSFHYLQRTWRLTPGGEAPSHEETGFIRVAEDGTVELLNAQGTDRVEVLHGRMHRNSDGGWELRLASVLHAHDERMRTASRTIRMQDQTLSYEMRMTTDRVASEEPHLTASLERDPSG